MPKPFLTYEQQLAKLRDEKHLVISDEESASNKLKRIGYYSLISGYKHLFRIPNQKNYKDGVSFDEIVALYEFDESLRELFLHYLLHIERHMRSLLSYYFTEKNGELQVSYLNKENYNYSRKHKNGIDRLVSELQKLAQTEQHPYIAYQRNNYHNVPLWVLVNALTFGMLSKMYFFFPSDLQSKGARISQALMKSSLVSFFLFSPSSVMCAPITNGSFLTDAEMLFRIQSFIKSWTFRKRAIHTNVGKQIYLPWSSLFAIYFPERNLSFSRKN